MAIQFNYNGNKGFRLLAIYERLNKGETISKPQLANDFGVTLKTVQRDIDDLRAYFAETHFDEGEVSIKYDKGRSGYYLVRFEREWLTNEEVLAICKILLESRAFNKIELNGLLKKLLAQIVPFDRKTIDEIIRSEKQCYVPLRHNKNLLKSIWMLSENIVNNEIITFKYKRKDGIQKEHSVKPVAIMFSEYYFYLVSFMANDSKEYPTIFRIDRITGIKSTKEKFTAPYNDKFSDGEFRKRVQFMYSGELKHVTFEFSGASIEAVLDRLPTAEVLKQENGFYTIRVEAYGDGIYMWLRSQGDWVKCL